jgi:hypothetical protein
LIVAGFLKASPATAPLVAAGTSAQLSRPPVSGARLGRDQAGNPAWFVADPTRPNSYQQLALS